MTENTGVIDCGSQTVKGGLAFVEDSEPRAVTPTAVRYTTGGEGGDNGDASMAAGGGLTLPMSRGVVEDWDAMEAIWHFLIYEEFGWELGREGNMLVSEPMCSSRGAREMVAHLMFEVFNVSGLYMAEAPLLSLYAFGKLTGCVVEIGDGTADIAPVLEGQLVSTSTAQLGVAGKDMTEHVRAALAARGVALTTEQAQALKNEHAKVAASREEYLKAVEGGSGGAPVTHTLPDGNTITVGPEERWGCGESLFEPSISDCDGPGVAELVHSCIMSCPIDNRRQMYENLCVCGGVGTMPGLPERLLSESKSFAPPSFAPSVLAPAEYMPEETVRYSSWMGGAILAKVVFPQSQQVTKWEYDEIGPSIIHRKCFS